jgi:hypothetical protein
MQVSGYWVGDLIRLDVAQVVKGHAP